MECQKFIPEGWKNAEEGFDFAQLKEAKMKGTVMQGLVQKCDTNYNLQIALGNDIIGIIPRNEVDIINQDDFGMTNPAICKNKVGQFVQFKIKDIYDENKLLLSRKQVRKRCIRLGKKGFKTWYGGKWNCKKYSKIWCFCRYWRRYYRASSY